MLLGMSRVSNRVIEKGGKMDNSGSTVASKVTSQKKSNVVGMKDRKCGSCTKEAGKDEDAVQCEICDTWYHINCISMSVDTFNLLSQECIHWFCMNCNKRVVKLLKSVARMEERQNQLESDQKEVRSQLEVVKESVKILESSLTEVKTLVEDKVLRGVDHSQDAPKESEALKKEDILESVEIEKRKMNIMLMGVSEDDRDKEVVDDILVKLGGQKGLSSVSCFDRLGRKSDKIRPIRVTLSNLDAKYEILAKARTLKMYEEYKRVFCVPDLTRKQQGEDKVLRSKLKEMRECGDKDVRIKRGKIVKNVNGAEVIVFSPRA